jgi:tetratricopeptide (TPR) repeat protein
MSVRNSHRETFFRIRADIWICLLLVLAISAVYLQVGSFEFVNFDDETYVSKSHYVQSGLTPSSIKWAFTTFYGGNWHPLTWLSHMLDCQLFGLSPGMHHLTSVFFHIVNTLLVFLVFKRMTGALWRCAFVAALFGLHPLHVESVAWISERKDVLSTLFWMLTIWSYVRYAERPGLARYMFMALFFVLGLISKPMTITLPFVLLLLDYWPLGRLGLWPSRVKDGSGFRISKGFRLILEKVPLFLLTVLSGIVTFLAEKSAGTVETLGFLPLGARAGNALVSLLNYLGKAIWPSDLMVFYPHPVNMPQWHVAGASLILGAVSLVAILFARRRPWFIVGWLWYLGTLVPVIGLIQVGLQGMADRYTYVPLIGIFVIMTWGAGDLLKAFPSGRAGLAAFATGAVLFLLGTASIQVGYWKNSTTLFEHALRVNKANYVAYNGLGVVAAEQERPGEAIRCYSVALRIKPDFALAYNNMGAVLASQGRTGRALESYSRALRLNPGLAQARNGLGVLLAQQGRMEEAAGHLEKALQIDPGYAEAHNNLGIILIKSGRTTDAIRHFVEAIGLNPGYGEAYFNLGHAWAAQGNLDEAEGSYLNAIRITPDHVGAHFALGNILVAKGRLDKAMDHYSESIRINPDSEEAHTNMGVALIQTGNVEEAIAHFREALRIRPDDPEVRDNLEKAKALQEKSP